MSETARDQYIEKLESQLREAQAACGAYKKVLLACQDKNPCPLCWSKELGHKPDCPFVAVLNNDVGRPLLDVVEAAKEVRDHYQGGGKPKPGFWSACGVLCKALATLETSTTGKELT